MKVYLSSWFASIEQMRKYRDELLAANIDVTSRWLEEKASPNAQVSDVSDDYLRTTAITDIDDILRSNIMVLFTPSKEDLESLPKASLARGGRHFEAGLHYATMLLEAYLPLSISSRGKRKLIVVGSKENVFHWLDGKFDANVYPEIIILPTWESTKKYLINHLGS